MVSMGLEFRAGRSDESPGRELLGELIEHLNAQYPGRSARPGSVTASDQMVAPHGVFLVGYEDELPVAIGGLRPCDTDVCEIKRMYVAPAARSRGVGRALLCALENAARDCGYERVRLDAGPRQEHSKRLFADCGYVEVGPYNANHIADYFAEKPL
jgi:GNAT superfamily N-acetyltransferase